eukprot:gnl/Spiro4/12849_TR6805_c0_g1_i1.p1 gnl/Spiro4/12849_TR6805_c0_g1~~gnl/Spiro4/12849_TR6805_c0_g1_i1.p1  ORF type:complete len:170 (+),score=47.66 gnl/Spiro4/12849_TR6805_c0_g1_i1:58-510(+)
MTAIDQLSLQQLDQVYKQLEEETQYLSNSMNGLRAAMARFQESSNTLASVTPESRGREMLVPLTSSLYVPGTLENVQTVIVDIGTGYYVRKTIPKAREFLQRKVDFLRNNLEMVAGNLDQKRKNLETVQMVMRQKFQEAAAGAPAPVPAH